MNRPTENVVMRRCFSKRGHGGLVVGSEMSGDVRNVFMYDCQFEGTDRAIRIKSRRGRGGVVENVWARNLKVKNMQREVVILNMDYSSDQKEAANSKPPIFRNMVISDVVGDGAPTAILIQGLEDSPIENVRFENIMITSTKGVVANYAQDLVFTNVNVTAANGPVFDMTHAAKITIENARAAKGTDTFLKVAGKSSRDIRIRASDLSEAKQKVVMAAEVSNSAATVQE